MNGGPPTGAAWADEAALAPELRTVVACAQAVIDRGRLPKLQEVLAECTDVDRLCATAIAQGMLGHLQRLVADRPAGAVDPALAGRLTELQRISAHRGLRQTGHLLRVLDALEAAGVVAMPVKGPAWAERFYGDVTLRTWADLDLLVPHSQVAPARDVLLANGFVDAGRFNARLAGSAQGGWGQVAFTAADHGVHVEVHWEVTVGFSARSLRPESLFARAEHLELLGRQVLTPSSVDLLLMTCLNGARDMWNTVERLLGLATQVRGTSPGDWPDVMTAARSAKCTRRVATAVSHVCRVFALEIPAEVGQAIGRDALGRALVRALGPGSLSREMGVNSRDHLSLLFWRFATEDSLLAGLGHAMMRFFRPGPEDWASVPLPSPLAWLYYPVRPVRLAFKWVGRLFSGARSSMLGL